MEKPITISPEHQLAAAEAVRNFYAENGYVYSELVSVLMPGADEDFAYQVAEDINLDGIIDESLQYSKKYGRHCEAFRQNLAHSSPFTARVNRLLPDAEYSGAETVQLMRAICSEKEYHPFPLESAEPIPTPQLIVGAQNTFSTGNIRWDWYIVCMLIHTPCDGGLFNGGKDAQSCEDGIKAAAGCLDYIESNFKTRWWQTAYYHINKLFEKGCAVPTEVSRMFEETLIKDLALFSDSWLIKQKLATYFIAVGRPLEAVPYIKDYLDAAGPKKGCYFLYFRNLLGVAYYKAGKYDEALAVFKRLAEADKSNRPMIYYNIAACYVQMGDFDSALTYLEKIEGTFEDWALKVVGPVDVKDEETYLEFREKSVSLFKDNNSKGALVYALKAVLLKSDDNILQYNVGVFYKQDDHAEKAVPYLERAAQLIPTNKYYWDYLGNAYFKVARYQDAIRACKRAIMLDSKYGWAHRNLGASYHKNGEYDKAMEESALAVKYAGNNEALKTSALTSLWEAYIAQQESRKKPIKAEKSEKVKKPKKNPSTIKWNY